MLFLDQLHSLDKEQDCPLPWTMFGAQVGRASSLAADTGTPLPSGPALTEKMPELFADLVGYASLNRYFAVSLEIIITH